MIVGFSWIDRKDLFVTNIHVRTKEVEEHIPRPQKPSLVDASEETCQVLVEQAEIAIDWSFLGQASYDVCRDETSEVTRVCGSWLTVSKMEVFMKVVSMALK